ncbi:S-adenosyl methyltransferase [Actinomadura hallensis]|uniref:S-adenosyl methyltransferase n=1 Tax=Actinomadura hallensis TaxID=337895 RepID=A0A543IGX3_9ACTN|nr:SAM-dependent methyltransferase [Actinomadura hallensis]TQM69833.1 S-adenosyl methyltransferase [Actinomadura hallensis]HLV76082.1 SAM-dependent methyltransferase [Vulgatibacteraceae bacterium]
MGDDLTEKAPPGIDPTTPTFARVYDYFLGGKDNFAADREVADMVMQLVPEAPVVARGNRAAIERAVTYMASDVGIDQFIDIGSGLPTASNVHQFARDANPAARVVYIDNDPIVLAHGRALLTESGVATFIQGDLYEPEKIFTDPALTGMIDLSRPVGVILAAIIHHVPDDRDPAGVVAALLPHLAPGSHVMLTHLHDSGDDPRVEEAKRVLQSGLGGSYFRHSSEIERFMDGLTILEPGVAHVTEWRPNGPTGPLEHPLHTQMVAVMGRKD